MARLKLLLLAVLFSSCVPTLLSSPNWVRVALAPDAMERNAACDRAVANAARRDFSTIVAGVVDLSPEDEGLKLFSSLGGTYTLCSVFGISGRKPESVPVSSSFIVIEQPGLKASQVTASIELNDGNGVVLRSVSPSSIEEDSEDVTASFRRWNGADFDAMNKAAFFTVVLNRGKGEEKYRVTRDMFESVLLLDPRSFNAR
jgi:hypothetical protein